MVGKGVTFEGGWSVAVAASGAEGVAVAVDRGAVCSVCVHAEARAVTIKTITDNAFLAKHERHLFKKNSFEGIWRQLITIVTYSKAGG